MDAAFENIFWQTSLWGNSVFDYVAALLIFVGVVFALKWMQWLVMRSVKGITKRTKTELPYRIQDCTESDIAVLLLL